MIVLLVLTPLAAAGSCGAHSGPSGSCATCAGAAGTLGTCSWCPLDQKCAQCYGAECKLETKCTGAQVIKAAAQCGGPANKWEPPPSKLISTCEYERTTCAHGTKMNNSYCQEILLVNWPYCNGTTCLIAPGKPGAGSVDAHKFPGVYVPQSGQLPKCKCPYWLNGTDCSLVVAPPALPKAHADFQVCGAAAAGGHQQSWDGSFINPK